MSKKPLTRSISIAQQRDDLKCNTTQAYDPFTCSTVLINQRFDQTAFISRSSSGVVLCQIAIMEAQKAPMAKYRKGLMFCQPNISMKRRNPLTDVSSQDTDD
mmetsp:Transcript_10365/g.34564  ORF Transcript_10365/g.34564 Transcript_10365/m.34564 type:complete len:102 (+) Transcript_10365:2047-2352(+)